MKVDRVKFQYGYSIRKDIEKCNDNNFNIYISKKSNENNTYIEYARGLYKASFVEESLNIIIHDWIREEERNNIKSSSNVTEYECNFINKVYTGINFESFNYVKKNRILINNIDDGTYYNPQIIFDENTAIIKNEDKIISRVRDNRNITLLKSINRKKDFVYVNGNNINIYSLKLIDKDETELKITIYEEESKVFKRIVRNIEIGSKLNNKIWLFFIEDKNNTVDGSMLLKLPDGNFYNCVLDGNELKIKSKDKRRKLYGLAYAVVRDYDKVEFTQKETEESGLIDDREKFNQITSGVSNNNGFMMLMNEYMDVEREMLKQAELECKSIKYISLERNKFVINTSSREMLESWSRKIGVTVKSKNSILGTLDEVGEDYIKVNFKDDMTRNSIARSHGILSISLLGDEIIQSRRQNAIKILENSSAANNDLGMILGGEYKFNDYKLNKIVKKYEIGNLVKKQIEAIEGVLNSPDIYLIQGPPGTGKTTVIRRIVKEIVESNEQVLVTSYQNLAVDNVLDGFLKESLIPFRFGNEDNEIMNKICEEIVDEINISLKENISFEKDKELEIFKVEIEELRHKMLSEDTSLLREMISHALNLIEANEGRTANYSKMNHVLDLLDKEQSKPKAEFDIKIVTNMIPDTYGFDFEVMESLINVEDYLTNLNYQIKSNTVSNILEKIKYLRDDETVFSLEDKEYQKIKHKILDDLKLIKIDGSDDIDYFTYQLEASSILDGIVENMPEYIEDDKYEVVKEFHNKIKKNPILIEDILNKYPDIRGTTCQKSASGKFVSATKGIDYEYVIVDEAARANPLDLIIPLIKGKKVILVGDHKQLPHMLEDYVESKFIEKENCDYGMFEEYIKQSLFGRLFYKLPDSRKTMLNTQYRMTKEIGDLVSELFYDNKLETGTKIINDTPLYTENALVYIDVKGKQRRTNSGSLVNEIEANEIIEKLKELNDKVILDKEKITVGIISFYKSQVEYLRPLVRSLNLDSIDVEVGTVDAYQGLEKDIIFLSSVRTQGIGFISNPNRLNVSLSRAKKLVVLFGDIRNLSEDTLFKKIINKCKDGRQL